MFLAIKEMLHQKTRFAMIILVIALVGYLTYFLTGLAYGLSTSYTQGIDSWSAKGIVLQSQANGNISRSLLSTSHYQQLELPDHNKAPLGSSVAALNLGQQVEVSLFGMDFDTFIAPTVTEGRSVQAAAEVVVSDALAKQGLQLGQTITFDGDSKPFTVVGFAERATFQTAPIVYLQLEDWREVASAVAGMTAMRDTTTINAIVVKEQPTNFDSDRLSYYSISDFIFELPGYSAQVATFSLMVGSLILIASFVLAIFIYILTIQKRTIFGILKAEGIPSSYIAQSVIMQIVLLSIVGLVIGSTLSIITGVALQGQVPFAIQPLFFAGIAISFLVCALIGGLASVKAVVNIDPVEAIE